ncbi:MAG: hypothetical protein ABR577_16590 [Pyrinomonadaceae bacterium]
MKNLFLRSLSARHAKAVAVLFVIIFALADFAGIAKAAAWNNLEPFKSRRADVERALGQPLGNTSGENAALKFKVAGGIITVAFVDAKFVEAKHLAPEIEGTIKEIILQHDNSSITPESLDLSHKSEFKRDEMRGKATAGSAVYRNPKDGIAYTFIGGRLKTTYYTPSVEQTARAQQKGAGK